LTKGADVNKQDTEGKTVIMAVLEDQLKRDSMELLNESFNIVMNKQQNRLYHFLSILVEHGVNPFIVDQNEHDAWEYAKLFPGGIETMKSTFLAN
jgi:ankyrin repeat protein